MSSSHFIACGMLRWRGFAGILLYRHIKTFITLYCVCGSKEDSTLLSMRGLSEAPREAGAPGLARRRLEPREVEMVAMGRLEVWGSWCPWSRDGVAASLGEMQV